MSGTLYIVATPIGNLEDVSLRCINTLSDIDIILAEDTRVTAKLLQFLSAFGFRHRQKTKQSGPNPSTGSVLNTQNSKPLLVSYHQHSPEAKKYEILRLLMEGKNIALVTDAGTPGISDPGNELVEFVSEANPDINIIPIPGASAVTTALSVSGMPADNFTFFGFFPKKKKTKVFEKIKNIGHTVVFFESPYRIKSTLKDIAQYLGGDTQVFVAQELTKVFEKKLRGSVTDVLQMLEKEEEELGRVKGEMVLIVNYKHP